MRIVFMGTPEFAVPSLEKLIDNDYPPVLVVTGQDKKRGRGQELSYTAVKKMALKHDVPLLQPASVRDPDFARELRNREPDLMVIVAFRILPPEVFTIPERGAFNLHASLLPAFRGAAPIQHALMSGVSETGVTTFFLKEKVDTGNIILQRRLEVGPNETAGQLHDRLAELGAEAVLDTVIAIEEGNVEPTPQDDSLSSPAPKIHREHARIRWDLPSDTVHNQIRAMSPVPGAWTMHGDVQLKIYETRPLLPEDAQARPAGTVISVEPEFRVACREGAVRILELQRAGRSKLSAEDFVNGYDISPGDVLS